MPNKQHNVLGEPLQPCCTDPVTGFLRDGYCARVPHDQGMHTLCAIVTEEFLTFSAKRGNDLTTPIPEYDFPGLNPGDHWCLCVLRWLEAHQAGCAPPVDLAATHISALEWVELDTLRKYAI